MLKKQNQQAVEEREEINAGTIAFLAIINEKFFCGRTQRAAQNQGERNKKSESHRTKDIGSEV